MIAKSNQNIFDFTLQEFGTLENLFDDVLVPNSLPVDQEIQANQEININAVGKGDDDIKIKISEQGLSMTNGEIPIIIEYRNGIVTNSFFGETAVFDFEAKINKNTPVTFTINWGVDVGISIIESTLVSGVWKALQTSILIPEGVDPNQTILVTDNFGGSYQVDYIIDVEFIPEYQTVYDSWTTKPSESVANAQNTMVESLVSSGVWAKLDVFYILAAHTDNNSEALTNWINPGTFDASLVNSPSFAAFEGFTRFGPDSYINTNYNPDNDAVNYSLNSASMGAYSRSDINEPRFDCGATGARASSIAIRWTNLFITRLNSSGAAVNANADSTGMFITSRPDSANIQNWRNKISLGNNAVVSTSISNLNLYILGANTGSPPISTGEKQLSMFMCGGSFTQQNVDDFTDAFEIYMDSNGKGVIP